jgi:hypothetical protein
MYGKIVLFNDSGKFEKGERIYLGNLEHKDESWLRDMVFDNPEILPRPLDFSMPLDGPRGFAPALRLPRGWAGQRPRPGGRAAHWVGKHRPQPLANDGEGIGGCWGPGWPAIALPRPPMSRMRQ